GHARSHGTGRGPGQAGRCRCPRVADGWAVGLRGARDRGQSARAFAPDRGGYALPDNVAFTVNLPHRRSFAPDAAFYVGELRMGFLEGAPRFAVQVRSESDYGPAAERKLARKRADYFAAGTLVVWDVDLLGADVVRVYRAREPERPTVY